MRIASFIGLCTSAALLGACAFDSAMKTARTSSELLAVAGGPQAKIERGDAGERWFYTTGPAGVQTWRIDVDKTGAILDRQQALSDETLGSIHRDMRADEVFAQIGPPYRKVRFERTHTTSWDYRFRDAWGYLADFCVLIDDGGQVSDRIIVRIDPLDSDN
jgi:hypothetical protein